MEQKNLFSERLKLARISKKLSQIELCNLIDISRVSLMHYETGRRIPSVEILEKIAEVLEVSVGFLLGKEELPKSNLRIDTMDCCMVNKPKRVRRKPEIEKVADKDILYKILSKDDTETKEVVNALLDYFMYDNRVNQKIKLSSTNTLIKDEDYEEFYLWTVQNALRKLKLVMKQK